MKTTIEWTHFSFNPVWGCLKVSEECQHCYADTLASRWGYQLWGPAANTPRRTFGEKHWQEPLKWNAQAQQQGTRFRVFCASMSDVYEDHPTVNQERPKVWSLIEQTPHLDWLLLTKRPENILRMTSRFLENMQLGTSVGTQKRVEERLPYMRAVRQSGFPGIIFLSCEPLLEHLTLTSHLDVVDWVITGAESSPGARPMNEDWVRSLRDQSLASGTAFFYKQKLVKGHKVPLPELDGEVWKQFPEIPSSSTAK